MKRNYSATTPMYHDSPLKNREIEKYSEVKKYDLPQLIENLLERTQTCYFIYNMLMLDRYKLLIILFSLLPNLWCAGIADAEGIKNGVVTCESIEPSVLEEMMASDQTIGIIDYRLPEHYYSGYIKGAILFSLNEREAIGLKSEKLVLKWKKEGQTGIIVDNDGSQSNIFCRNLRLRFKYKKIYNLKGGMNKWRGSTYKEDFHILSLALSRLWKENENTPFVFLIPKDPFTWTGINVESGKAIFWGKGKCSTCHAVGDKGSATRCPNLGKQGKKFPQPIGQRALNHAKDREKNRGKHYTAADYLIESIARPNAYVVDGYKKEMPKVFEPPISLSSDEIKSVLVYLLSLRYEEINEEDIEAIISPDSDVGKEMINEIETAIVSANTAKKTSKLKPYIEGDPFEGRRIFFDPKSNAPCAKCHTVKGKGGKIGPDLSAIAATRATDFIVESILEPSKKIASGFDPVLVITEDMRYIAGIKKSENDTFIELMQGNGELIKIYKDEISILSLQKKSFMPENFAEFMSVQQFHDLLAYLQTLTGGPPPIPKKAE